MLLKEVAEASVLVSESSARLKKIEILAACLARMTPQEVAIGVAYLAGDLSQGRIGVGYAAIRAALSEPEASAASLTLSDVDATFSRIASLCRAGSARARGNALGELMTRSTRVEQDFLRRLLAGELRQGAQEGVMVDALARALNVPSRDVRRALMLSGNMGEVARAVLADGARALADFRLKLFCPFQPMLAQTAQDSSAALSRFGTALLEYKLDGARIQVHRSGDDVRIFTRGLHDVTARAPEIVELVRALPARELILDGEAIALRADGTPLPFQVTMRRFGRKLDVESMQKSLPITPFFFDVLHIDGQDLLDLPAESRFSAMHAVVTPGALIPRRIATSVDELHTFASEALERGHEGLMIKSLQAPYEAGRRGASWLKFKPTHSLDLVVLAAEWGNGRRQGWLSNLHLGARDPERAGFVMLGKTFKGMTDSLLEWQTRELLQREVGRDAYTVHVKPELVVEILFDGVQTSSHYPAGLTLRFARVKRYRPDKRAEEADVIDSVRAIHAQSSASGELCAR